MLKTVAPNLNIGIHTLRSGGASVAANSDVNDKCLQRHGRWKSVSSKNIYIKDSVVKRLQVSKKLGL